MVASTNTTTSSDNRGGNSFSKANVWSLPQNVWSNGGHLFIASFFSVERVILCKNATIVPTTITTTF